MSICCKDCAEKEIARQFAVITDLQSENAKLKAENLALLTTLGRYGRHDADCEVPADICHCGWDAVVDQYAPFH